MRVKSKPPALNAAIVETKKKAVFKRLSQDFTTVFSISITLSSDLIEKGASSLEHSVAQFIHLLG